MSSKSSPIIINEPCDQYEPCDQSAFVEFTKSLMARVKKYNGKAITGYSVPATPLEQFKPIQINNLEFKKLLKETDNA